MITDYNPEPDTVELLPDKNSGNWRLSFTDRDTGDEIGIELNDTVFPEFGKEFAELEHLF